MKSRLKDCDSAFLFFMKIEASIVLREMRADFQQLRPWDRQDGMLNTCPAKVYYWIHVGNLDLHEKHTWFFRPWGKGPLDPPPSIWNLDRNLIVGHERSPKNFIRGLYVDWFKRYCGLKVEKFFQPISKIFFFILFRIWQGIQITKHHLSKSVLVFEL